MHYMLLFVFFPRRFHSILCAFIDADYVCACDYVCIYLTVVRRSFLAIDKSQMRSHPFD